MKSLIHSNLKTLETQRDDDKDPICVHVGINDTFLAFIAPQNLAIPSRKSWSELQLNFLTSYSTNSVDGILHILTFYFSIYIYTYINKTFDYLTQGLKFKMKMNKTRALNQVLRCTI